ncbi:TonB-dependent receptor plug domain-containing protein [Elongatibacter sediminis]|uniref:TonB-dependent receptor n=1 Tax=Elongatibacter sediminis TaxID=3119006 RepID=A0AAW9RAG5_9GAMM
MINRDLRRKMNSNMHLPGWALIRLLLTATACLASVAAWGSAELQNDAGKVNSPSGAEANPRPSPDESTAESAGTAFPLPEIIVTRRRARAPSSVIVRDVTPADFAAWNAHTVGDSLTYVPGVNVQIGGSSADSRAWIRGFRDRDVLVLYDGIPIASGFEGTVDLNEISLTAVRNIQVMKSAPSVIYGTNGMGGVIDVIPQTRVDDDYLAGGAELGSDGRKLIRASAGGGNGSVSYAASASYQRADDYSLSEGFDAVAYQPAGTRVNSDFRRSNLFVSLDAAETPLGHASVFFNVSDAEKGLPPEAGSDDPDFERLTHSLRTTLGVSNRFAHLPLTAKLYYNSYDSDLTAYTDASYGEVDEIETAEDYSLGGKLYATLETSGHNQLVISGGVQKDVYMAEGELENGNKAELATWTLAVEDQYWINDRLSLAAGLIHTYFDQTRLDRTRSATNPQIALAWRVSRPLSIHASAAQRTRFPKLRELYRRRWGNPDLKEQTANNYELGLRYEHRPGWSSDLSLFRSDVDDLIERPNRDSLYQNLDRVTLSGIELASRGWISDDLFAGLAYTCVDAEEKLDDGTSRQLRSRPRHTVMLELRYRLTADTLISVNSIRVSGLYDLTGDGVHTRVPSYLVFNARASHAFAGRWEAYVAVSNAFDEDYVQRLGNPREGRAWLAGIGFDF